MINIRNIENLEELNIFRNLQCDELHVLKISTSWCGPCRVLGDTIKNLDRDKIGTTLFAEIDADKEEFDDTLAELGIRGVPVLIYYKNGEEVKRSTGLVSANDIYKNINELE